jgi:hypothetical protein
MRSGFPGNDRPTNTDSQQFPNGKKMIFLYRVSAVKEKAGILDPAHSSQEMSLP